MSLLKKIMKHPSLLDSNDERIVVRYNITLSLKKKDGVKDHKGKARPKS